MKTFRIWHGDGSQENVEGKTATVEKTSSGLKIKIGKKKYSGAVGFVEVTEDIKIVQAS